jgi:S-layer homology domain.
MPKGLKTLIVAIVIISLNIIPCLECFAENTTPDHDLSLGAVEAVKVLKSKNIVPQEFFADFKKNISREQFAMLAVSIYKQAKKDADIPKKDKFTDIESCKYKKEIEEAFSLGIVKGYDSTGTKFSPTRNIPRQEICVMLVRLLKAIDPKLNTIVKDNIAFKDLTKISSWALNDVKYAYKNKIVLGIAELTIGPAKTITREQALVMVYRLAVKYIGLCTTQVGDDVSPILLSAIPDNNATVRLHFNDIINLDQAVFTIITASNPSDSLTITEIKKEMDGKTVLLTTKAQKASELYKVSITGITDASGVVLKDMTASFTGFSDNSQHEVKLLSVKALTSTSVEAVFDSPVSLQGLSISITEKYGTKHILAIKQSSLSLDGKTITLTTDNQNSSILYDLSVSGSETINGLLLKSQTLTFVGMKPSQSAVVAPAIKPLYAKALENTRVEVVFEIPVQLDGLTFSINELYGSKQEVPVYNITISKDKKTVILVTGQQKSITLYAVKINGLKAVDGSEASEQKVTFAGIGTDGLLPPDLFVESTINIVSISVVSNTCIKVSFDKAINNEATFSIDDLSIIDKSMADSGKLIIINTASQTSGKIYYLKVSNLMSVILEPNAKQEKSFTGADYPEIVSLKVIDVIDSSKVFVSFNKKIDISNAIFTIKETTENVPPIAITKIDLGSTGDTVNIFTAPRNYSKDYVLDISGLRTADGIPSANLQTTFTDGYYGEPISISGINVTNSMIKVFFKNYVDDMSNAIFTIEEADENSAPISITRISPGPIGYDVEIYTDPQTPGKKYVLHISGLKTEYGYTCPDMETSFTGADYPSLISIHHISVSGNNKVFVSFNAFGKVDISNAVITVKEATGNKASLAIEKISQEYSDTCIDIITSPQITGMQYVLTISGLKTATGEPSAEMQATFIGG